MEGERFDFDDWVARGMVDLGGGQVNTQLIFFQFCVIHDGFRPRITFSFSEESE
jgi:hypothetical protein